MWGRAVRRRLLVTAPRPGCPPQTPFSWNASEGAFDAAMKGDRLFALLLSVMGLRPAGVCCLRWSDIDLDAATLSIANTRTVMGRRTVVDKDTKSMAGELDANGLRGSVCTMLGRLASRSSPTTGCRITWCGSGHGRTGLVTGR